MARRGIELEVKFAPVGEQTLVDLAARREFPGWRVTGRHDEAQRNTYFDTPDALLEAASCSLRRRRLDDGAAGIEWTFKRGRGPGRDGVARRREINALLPGKKGETRGEFPKGKCAPIDRARQVAGTQSLQPLFTLLTTRHQIELTRADGARVALALDRIALVNDALYRETEIEIELFDGDERAVAELALWLMRTYGVLPMRGSKRGRALAWRRGLGLPVVAPALALDLLATRAASNTAAGIPSTIVLASPRGSEQAQHLADALAARVPTAQLAQGAAVTSRQNGVAIVVRESIAAGQQPTLAAWVKVGLPRPLLARLTADAATAGRDPWTILRRLGEYVVPSQRRFLDPAARDADLIVIDNLPPAVGDQHLMPTEQVKFIGWPGDAILEERGATALGSTREDDYFFSLPATAADDGASPLRVRLCEDTAWVSYAEGGLIATHEARPRILTLLRNLGYNEVGSVSKTRRRYRLGGWEIALDQVAQLGHFCELRRVTADDCALDTLIAALGLTTIARTKDTYRQLQRALHDGPTSTGLDTVEDR
jgi:adenylate cyclase class IV